MEFDLNLILELVLLVGGILLVNRFITLWDVRERLKLTKQQQISAEMARRARLKAAPPTQRQRDERDDDADEAPQVGDWVPHLLETFGVDPDLLYEEDMPPQVKLFLPLVKGYVQSQGGLEGIVAGLKTRGESAASPTGGSLGVPDGNGL